MKAPRYRSKLESSFAQTFPDLLYEAVHLPYVVTHVYTPDWQVTETAFIETKGLWLAADRSKIKYVLTQHPEIQLLLVFQDPNKRLSSSSKTTYAAWCDRHGISWAAATDTAKIQMWINQTRK